MKTEVSESSINSFRAHNATGRSDDQRQKIMKLLAMTGATSFDAGMTRKEIAVALGMEPGSVGGRVNKLVTDTLLTENEGMHRKCKISGKFVKVVWIAGAQDRTQ